MFPVMAGDPPVLVLVGTLPLTITVSPEDALLLPVDVADGAEVIDAVVVVVVVAAALLPAVAVACATRDEKSEAVRGTCGRPEGHPEWPPFPPKLSPPVLTDPLQLASLMDVLLSPTQQTLPQMLPGQHIALPLHVNIGPLQSWRENRFWVGGRDVSNKSFFLFWFNS
jgi:hypothetical protein